MVSNTVTSPQGLLTIALQYNFISLKRQSCIHTDNGRRLLRNAGTYLHQLKKILVILLTVRKRKFSFLQCIKTRSWGFYPWVQSCWIIKLTTHLHLVLRLRIQYIIPAFLLCLLAYTGATLPFTFYQQQKYLNLTYFLVNSLVLLLNTFVQILQWV